MIRVADYVMQWLVQHNIQDIFLVTGGGAMHLNDAIGRSKLSYTCFHHEQACTMAADSYYRLTGRLAAVNVTSGPGGTNAITGVYGAYVDSLAMIVLSGQVKFETTVQSTGLPLRQLGDQEIDIVSLVKPITKYAEMITDPLSIRYHLEKALYLATTGRPGPVWLDIPLDVQGAKIDPARLEGYQPEVISTQTNLAEHTHFILEKLKTAQRPVIFAGSGIRLGHAEAEFLQCVDAWGIPVVTAWNAHDVIWDDHPYYVGRPGTVGNRSGNFVVQNADFLLILGCRLNIRQISYDWKNFARAAYKVIVDIDAVELKKPTHQPDLAIHADVKDVLQGFLRADWTPQAHHRAWLQWCLKRKEAYPVVLSEYWSQHAVNPYCFIASLFQELEEHDIVVTGDGTAVVVSFQAAFIKKNQRLYSNSGCAPMGYDLPAAIGAWIASRRRVICLAGDGSIQMNLQELQTLVTHQMDIKIFIFNNEGYHSIRQTQQAYFADSPIGYQSDNGIGFPSFEKLAYAYGIPYQACRNHSELTSQICKTLHQEGPQICELFLNINQVFAPKLASRKLASGKMVSSPLEDMFPFLSREEFQSNMIIPILAQSEEI